MSQKWTHNFLSQAIDGGYYELAFDLLQSNQNKSRPIQTPSRVHATQGFGCACVTLTRYTADKLNVSVPLMISVPSTTTCPNNGVVCEGRKREREKESEKGGGEEERTDDEVYTGKYNAHICINVNVAAREPFHECSCYHVGDKTHARAHTHTHTKSVRE